MSVQWMHHCLPERLGGRTERRCMGSRCTGSRITGGEEALWYALFAINGEGIPGLLVRGLETMPNVTSQMKVVRIS